MDGSLVWVLLAPAPRQWLEERVAAVLGERNFDVKDFLSRWEFLDCGGERSALLNRIPGSEQTQEVFFAEKFSNELGQPVHVLYTSPDYAGTEVIDVYEGGRMTGGVRGDPYRFARRMGCELPRED